MQHLLVKQLRPEQEIVASNAPLMDLILVLQETQRRHSWREWTVSAQYLRAS